MLVKRTGKLFFQTTSTKITTSWKCSLLIIHTFLKKNNIKKQQKNQKYFRNNQILLTDNYSY